MSILWAFMRLDAETSGGPAAWPGQCHHIQVTANLRAKVITAPPVA
ncbi:hypothetical protein AB0K74_39685 [Streptomyces sp. NPDC056159]